MSDETWNSDTGPLVSTAWLADHLEAPDVRVVDATYYLPVEAKVGREEYLASHIPGAVYFDIDEIADDSNALPHMLPQPEKFSSRVRKMGLGDGVRIVVYDGRGVFSAPRVWWMFRLFGHQDVCVLDGGLPKWVAEGRPTAS
ncbi:MAG: rhodanese-like domain-containing protein, partial [Pseudomonadota bacterium]